MKQEYYPAGGDDPGRWPYYKNQVKDKNLVKWLKTQGCPVNLGENFCLEKGMGEWLTITILDKETVQFEYFGIEEVTNE